MGGRQRSIFADMRRDREGERGREGGIGAENKREL